MIHPFREGNGRTQYLFIEQVARQKGFQLDLGNIDKIDMIIAAKESVGSDHAFVDIMKPRLRDREYTAVKVQAVTEIQNELVAIEAAMASAIGSDPQFAEGLMRSVEQRMINVRTQISAAPNTSESRNQLRMLSARLEKLNRRRENRNDILQDGLGTRS